MKLLEEAIGKNLCEVSQTEIRQLPHKHCSPRKKGYIVGAAHKISAGREARG